MKRFILLFIIVFSVACEKYDDQYEVELAPAPIQTEGISTHEVIRYEKDTLVTVDVVETRGPETELDNNGDADMFDYFSKTLTTTTTVITTTKITETIETVNTFVDYVLTSTTTEVIDSVSESTERVKVEEDAVYEFVNRISNDDRIEKAVRYFLERAEAHGLPTDWIDNKRNKVVTDVELPENVAGRASLGNWATLNVRINLDLIDGHIAETYGQAVADVILTNTVFHELGHNLLAAKHSTDPNSLMFWSVSNNLEDVFNKLEVILEQKATLPDALFRSKYLSGKTSKTCGHSH